MFNLPLTVLAVSTRAELDNNLKQYLSYHIKKNIIIITNNDSLLDNNSNMKNEILQCDIYADDILHFLEKQTNKTFFIDIYLSSIIHGKKQINTKQIFLKRLMDIINKNSLNVTLITQTYTTLAGSVISTGGNVVLYMSYKYLLYNDGNLSIMKDRSGNKHEIDLLNWRKLFRKNKIKNILET